MWRLIKDVWTVHVEQAKARKAARMLIKQEWSLELLVLLLVKATKLKKQGCTIILKNKAGQELLLSQDALPVQQALVKDVDTGDVLQTISLEQMLDEAWANGRL